MSKKIDQILEVLSIIRDEYLSNSSRPLEDIRVEATIVVAKKHKLWSTTVLDKYQRGLKPYTYGTKSFDNLVRGWLVQKSPSLETILLSHSENETDKSNVSNFFQSVNLEFPDVIGSIGSNKESAIRRNLYTRMQHLASIIEEKFEKFEYDKNFDPSIINDQRLRIACELVQRLGQRKFREDLMVLYGGQCAITGTNVKEALEAAHIIPYSGDQTDHPKNGLLLRADIHNLFDFGLISIDEATYSVIISKAMYGSSYQEYDGRKLYLPDNEQFWPSQEALKQHREEAQLATSTSMKNLPNKAFLRNPIDQTGSQHSG